MKKGTKTYEKRLKTSEYKVEYVNPTNVLPYNTANALARCWLEGCYTNEFMLDTFFLEERIGNKGSLYKSFFPLLECATACAATYGVQSNSFSLFHLLRFSSCLC